MTNKLPLILGLLLTTACGDNTKDPEPSAEPSGEPATEPSGESTRESTRIRWNLAGRNPFQSV